MLLVKENPICDDEAGLFAAASKAGYKFVERAAQRQLVLKKLREKGVDVYTTASVEAYKAAKAGVGPVNKWLLVLAVAILSCCVCSGWCASILNSEQHPFCMAIACLSGVAFFVVGCWVWSLAFDLGIRGRYMWDEIPLKDYDREIPEYVLNDLVTAHQLCPKAKFSVEELTRQQVVVDPLLWMEFGDQMYCIQVWDEPDFKAKRAYEN